ncbi:M23 family metallopeptidase [Corticibacter populi]|uniref:M23 family metallopeptidase n=1 Tax=Corticibacter populi TaxID=1550736 RepID=A0A3M6QIW7_9BURK|nr:M23 family metallopeptidase [Corticibacter populi]RMX02998.1 M23 family metallopeptidase [Corticibacter populi]RZS33428.1 peptidase M23-like protein [Corticibacter populi]
MSILNSCAKNSIHRRYGRRIVAWCARRPAGALLLALSLGQTGAALAQAAPAADARLAFPASVQQGSMVIGRVVPGSTVRYRDRTLRTTGYGTVVFGVGRNETGPAVLQVQSPDGQASSVSIAVTGRDWPTEYVNGVPPKTVNPPAAIAERIRREQAQVTAARERDDDRADFAQRFIWPVQGRISGRFGNARVYNGLPSGSGHSGMDIAAPTGTPVKAPAAGIVTFAADNLYLTGGTLLLDHGFGISSNFLHLSRIDVKVGERVEQGQVIAAVGATGRATGPHLHWGMNWFDVRIDPLLVLERP